MRSDASPFIHVFDAEAEAEARAPAPAWDYIRGGSGDEHSLKRNRRAFDDWSLQPRVLVDVETCDPSTSVLGTPVAWPVLAAPLGLQGLVHPKGELPTTRAVGRAGTLMTLSTMSNTSLEDVAAAACGPLWYQLYVFRDRAWTASLVQRAERAGYRAIVLTVDTPVAGRRERDARNGFSLPDGLTLPHVPPAARASALRDGAPGTSGLMRHTSAAIDASLSWRDLAWLRDQTRLPLILKGVMTADDAQIAVQHGIEGIIVSNHGGRQLDGVDATIEALPPVVEAVGDACEVYLDGGIRRGIDVLKALALGARAVLVGRPLLWGLAARGEEGVAEVLAVLRAEVELAMRLSGRPRLADISETLLRRRR
jgi:4-hydroxymandelate oxidase